MQPFDFTKVPKQFCDNVNVGVNKEAIVLAMFSGETVGIYALSPEHAKRLSLMLSYNIADYEKKFGEIKTEWSPNVPSPIHFDDLSGPKK
jgi:hypothetical protein